MIRCRAVRCAFLTHRAESGSKQKGSNYDQANVQTEDYAGTLCLPDLSDRDVYGGRPCAGDGLLAGVRHGIERSASVAGIRHHFCADDAMRHAGSAHGFRATTHQARRMTRQRFLWLCAMAVLVGCATTNDDARAQGGVAQLNVHAVTVLRDPSSTSGSLVLALEQVSRQEAAVFGRMAKPVKAATDAWSELGKMGGRPIVAVTEYRDWIWYATDVARDPGTQEVRMFIAGYAIRK